MSRDANFRMWNERKGVTGESWGLREEVWELIDEGGEIRNKEKWREMRDEWWMLEEKWGILDTRGEMKDEGEGEGGVFEVRDMRGIQFYAKYASLNIITLDDN